MAVTVTPVTSGANIRVSDVEATDDADVAAVIPHGLGEAPLDVTLTPMAANFFTKAWRLGVVDATNVNLVATGAVGSGAAGSSVRVIARRPHSIVR